MPDRSQYLVDPQTGKAAVVDSADVQRAVESGYTPASDEQVARLNTKLSAQQDTFGGVKAFAEKAVEALPPVALAGIPAAAMAAIPSLEEYGQPKNWEEYSKARQAKETREGLARTLAKYTTVSGLEQTLGISSAEDIKAREEEYPIASGAGTIAGILSPSIAGAAAKRIPGAIKGAADAAAKLAATEAAASAAIEAGSTEGVALARAAVDQAPRVQALQQAADKTLTSRAIKSLSADTFNRSAEDAIKRTIELTPGLSRISPVAKEIVSKSLSVPIGSAIEGALLTSGQIADETALGRTDLASEKILAELEEGALFNAGVSSVLGLTGVGARGLIRAGKAGASKTRDFIVEKFPAVSAWMTGGDIEDIATATTRRGELKDKSLREMINERLGSVGEAPVMRETLPMPEAPVAKPKPIKPEIIKTEAGRFRTPSETFTPSSGPVAPTLKPSEANKIAREFSDILEQRHKATSDLEMWANAELRKIETGKIIDTRVNRQTAELEQQMLDSIGTRTPTFAENVMLEDIRSGRAAAIPYRNAAYGLLEDAKRLVSLVDDPLKYPDVVRKRMSDAAEKLESFLSTDPSPAEIHSKLKKMKRDIWDKTIPREERASIKLADQMSNGAIMGLHRRFVDMLSDSDLWGYAGKREAEFNQMLTERDPAVKRHLKDFFKLVPTKGGNKVYEIDREAVLKKVRKLKIDPATGMPDEASVGWLRNMKTVLDSDSRLIDEVQKTDLYAKQNFNKEMLAETLREASAASSKAIDEAMSAAANKVKLAEFSAAKAAHKLETETARAEFNAQQAIKQQKELEAKAASEVAKASSKEEAVAIRAEYKRTLEAYKAETEAAEKEYQQAKAASIEDKRLAAEELKSASEQYKELLAKRDADISKRLNAIGSGAKAGGLMDAIDVAHKGAALGYYIHPVIGWLASIGAGATKLASNPERNMKTLASLERMANSASRKIDAGTSAIIRSGAPTTIRRLATAGTVLSAKQEREQYQKNIDSVRTLAAGDDNAFNKLDEFNGPLSDDAPGIASHANTVTSAAASYLDSKAPRPPANLPPMQLKGWQPTDAQVREYNRIHRTVDMPLSILADASEGTLIRQQVQAVEAVYPALMGEIRDRIVTGLEENPDITASRRRTISMLLGVDIDGQTSPAMAMSAQSLYQQQQQQQPEAKMPASRAGKLNIANRAEYDTTARREAQRGVGSWNRMR